MVFISATRLRLRSAWFLLPFLRSNSRTLKQLKRESAFIKGKLLVDRRLTFWTLTAWRNEQDMHAYRNSGAHLEAMPKLINWCDEAHAAHWSQDGEELPAWHQVYQRIIAPEARVSKVRYPSKDHNTKNVPAPRYPSRLEQTLLPR